jgi:hypothetical protein
MHARIDDPPPRAPAHRSRPRRSRRYRAVRGPAEAADPSLTPEDMGASPWPDASPTSGTLAHTTGSSDLHAGPELAGYRPSTRFGYLFKSYYEAIGPGSRGRRGA